MSLTSARGRSLSAYCGVCLSLYTPHGRARFLRRRRLRFFIRVAPHSFLPMRQYCHKFEVSLFRRFGCPGATTNESWRRPEQKDLPWLEKDEFKHVGGISTWKWTTAGRETVWSFASRTIHKRLASTGQPLHVEAPATQPWLLSFLDGWLCLRALATLQPW